MNLLGLQKLTLLDFPEKTACTVFTGGCDFRCPFCHNASLVEGVGETEPLSVDEFFAFLEKRKKVLQGVCITGGEPTVQKDLKEFILKIRRLGYLVKLDTNGNHPNILKNLVEENLLDYVAMDVKNDLPNYGKTVGVADFDTSKIEESVDFLLENHVDYEFRTTVVKELHTMESIDNLTRWIRGAKRYYLQQFVDSGDILRDGYSGYHKDKMEMLLNIARKNLPVTELRGLS